MVDEYTKRRDEIVSQINEIDNSMFFCVLYGRYIAGLSLHSIGEYAGRQSRQMRNINGRALQAFEKKFGEKYRDL
jgi:hypothetical protein